MMREEDRYQTIAEFMAALDGAEGGAWIPERRVPVIERLADWFRRSPQGVAGEGAGIAEGVAKTAPPVALPPKPVPPRPVAREIIVPAALPKLTTNPKDGAELIYIPAGKFLMGDDDKKNNPIQTVELTDYYIYKNAVTVEQYAAYCMAVGKEMPPPPDFNPEWSKRDHPIVKVTWAESRAYAQWAEGDLPSEAQWERAARGTDGRKYPWGGEFDGSKCWCSKETWGDAGGTTAVGKYGVSPDGCTDMAGNVYQWCLDRYNSSPAALLVNPVLRGGSWVDIIPGIFRCANQYIIVKPTGRNLYSGFRCVFRVNS